MGRLCDAGPCTPPAPAVAGAYEAPPVSTDTSLLSPLPCSFQLQILPSGNVVWCGGTLTRPTAAAVLPAPPAGATAAAGSSADARCSTASSMMPQAAQGIFTQSSSQAVQLAWHGVGVRGSVHLPGKRDRADGDDGRAGSREGMRLLPNARSIMSVVKRQFYLKKQLGGMW